MITPEEIRILREKIMSGKMTAEEKLLMLKELNAAIGGMRQNLAILKNVNEDEEIKKDGANP